MERILKELPRDDGSGSWSIEDAEAEDLSLILPVLRALSEDHAGRPTKLEARWIATIRRAYPKLDDLPLVAQLAMYAARGEPLQTMVEQVLMYTPWLDDAEALARAIDRKLVPFNVAFAFGYETQVAKHQGRFNRERKEQPNER